jgi:hypothetical protein
MRHVSYKILENSGRTTEITPRSVTASASLSAAKEIKKI